ncbi:MAG: MFS transporter [Thaumarchaeota archaeon]|nr:MFS transporter [Nitrososphaerota archaeon]
MEYSVLSSRPYLNPTVIAISIASANVMIGFGLFIPFLPYYATLLGASLALQIGAMGSGFVIARALTAVPFGKLSDRIGRKPVIILGLVIYSIGTLVFPFAQTWIHLVLFRVIQGMGGGMFWPAGTALITDSVPAGQRGRALGFFHAFVMLGLVFGPAIGGAIQVYSLEFLGLQEIDSYRITFYVGGIFAIASAIIAFIMIKEPGRRQAVTNKISDMTIAPSLKRTFNALLAVRFANGFALSFIQPILALYMVDTLGLVRTTAVIWMATAFFISGLVGAGIQFPAGALADKRDRKKIMLLAMSAGAIATIFMPFAGTVIFIVILMAIRTGFLGLYQPSVLSLQQDIIPSGARGKFTGLGDAAWNLGAIIGPLSLVLYDFVDKAYPFYLSAVVSLSTVVVFYFVGKEPKNLKSDA